MTIFSPRLALRAGFAGVLAVTLVFSAGCGKSKKNDSSVSGKVTYANKPVTGGTIRLSPAEGTGQPIPVTINSDGTFSSKGIPTGDMKVVIETESVRGQTGNPYPNPMKGKRPPGSGPEVKPPDLDTSK